MIGINELYVKTYDFNSLTVHWEYEYLPPGTVLATTTVDIQRSEAPDFSAYETIAAGLNADNVNSYTDTNLSGVLTRRYHDMNYRLRFVEDDGEETVTNKTYLTAPIHLPAKAIIRRKNDILRLRGLPMKFLKRKTNGTECTACKDPITDMQITDNCEVCYNTGFVGGYYSAIDTQGFITQTPDVNTINRFGEFNPGQAIYSTTNYPEISVNDVLVDHLNRRWWINQIQNVSYRGYTLSQDARMTLADHNDVIYDFEVT